MRRTLQEQRALINALVERQNQQDLEAERQLAERRAEEERRHAEEERQNAEDELDDDEDEENAEEDEEDNESERSRSPPRHRRGEKNTQYWVNQFCKLKPPTFRGKLDMAEDWLKRLEKVFKVIDCPEDRKAQLAIYQLEGDADRWWEVTAETLRTQYYPVTWEKFLEKFHDQYFPPSVQMNKESEFLHIRQRYEESFDEYYARFTNLSRYSPHLRKGNDERSMVNILIDGLKYEIGERLMSQRFQNLTSAVETCRMTERNLKGFQRSRNFNNNNSNAGRGGISSGNSSQKKRAPWNNPSDGNKRPFQPGQPNFPETQGPRPCPKCGGYHKGTDCDGKQICYKCQRPGHISRDCPQRAAGMGPQNPGRVFALTCEETGEPSGVVHDTRAL